MTTSPEQSARASSGVCSSAARPVALSRSNTGYPLEPLRYLSRQGGFPHLPRPEQATTGDSRSRKGDVLQQPAARYLLHIVIL